jgi:hypothetical protein
LIEPVASGGSAGDISFVANDMRLRQGAAGQLEASGKITVPAAGKARGEGVIRVGGGSLTTASRAELAKAVAAPLESVLPGFAASAARTMDQAARSFEVVAPWSAQMTEGGIDISALNGAALHAQSGFTVALEAGSGENEVVTFSTDTGGRWKAAGSLRMSGGGGPQLDVELARASGGGRVVSLAGAAQLRAWRVGDDVLAAEATGLAFDTNEAGGSAAGQFTVRLDGGLAGGVWKAARATGQVKAVWTPDSFIADAERGLVIQWDEGRYGDTVFGAGALHYTPRGRLAELQGEVVAGQGVFAEVRMPVRGASFQGDLTLGQTAVNWQAEGGLRAGFDAAPSTLALKLGERATPVRIGDISGTMDLRRGWRLTGGFSGGEVKADEATVADLAGKFDLGGEHGSLDGSLSDVTLRVFDPLEADKRRYEEAKFAGSATLIDGVAGFSGTFTLANKGVQIATVKGGHSLETGSGSLTFEPTPLVFIPRAFQPYDLSPLLRGPANVTGRADISGGVSWSGAGIEADATLNLRGIGFALASAGVFEGVSGRVEVSDLINMTSAPGQTITIDKVTLGLPIEDGTIRFQLIGYDAIRLERAEWPFVGGFIRLRPADFRFDAEENRIVAQAVDWDLNRIIELFSVPDLKLDGIVSGDVPVVFSTGSARIDKAQLQASQKGGAIQFTGSAGDAASQSDPNAKMLFDALKDFRYRVLKVGLDGDIAGRIVLSMNLLGSNPDVLKGAPFELNISVDSALMNLLNMASWQDQMKAQISTPSTAPNGAPD